ncbi:hypothetical protein [Nannocystis pusilla]|uniref:hypothetical protein n=1 Tax=Nannocystis pusilla TaxID=889268 RepID=UPI003BEFF209
MDQKTKGAWIVHHTQKLQHVTGGAASEFETISVAGKMGLLLSSLAATSQSVLTTEQVNALAKSAGITVNLELPTLLTRLEERNLVSRAQSGIDILGVTTASVLEHTASAFDSLRPSASEQAALDLAEKVSIEPLDTVFATEYVGDTFKLSKSDVADFLVQTEEVSFFDAELIEPGKKLLFNGHLFRREDAKKVQAVMQSLTEENHRKIGEVEDLLRRCGCITLSEAHAILGEPMFSKLHVIGMYDVSEVSNDSESVLYVTKPSAFTKFSNSFVDDAMDMAKAFVTCLTYGMYRSASSRGQIQMLTRLMKKLIDGFWVGPATAIGQDYRVLEVRRVVELRNDGGGMYSMRLLKKDIGQLALQVLTAGDASEHSLLNFPSAAVAKYIPPEVKRTATRRTQTSASKRQTTTILSALRTGKFSR